jgi:hypothetical protein
MRSEVLTAMKMSIVIFRVVMQCGLVSGYQRFGRSRYVTRNAGSHLQDHLTSQPGRLWPTSSPPHLTDTQRTDRKHGYFQISHTEKCLGTFLFGTWQRCCLITVLVCDIFALPGATNRLCPHTRNKKLITQSGQASVGDGSQAGCCSLHWWLCTRTSLS